MSCSVLRILSTACSPSVLPFRANCERAFVCSPITANDSLATTLPFELSASSVSILSVRPLKIASISGDNATLLLVSGDMFSVFCVFLCVQGDN